MFKNQEEVERFFRSQSTGTTSYPNLVVKESDSFRLVIYRVNKKSVYDIETLYRVETIYGTIMDNSSVAIKTYESGLRFFNRLQSTMRI